MSNKKSSSITFRLGAEEQEAIERIRSHSALSACSLSQILRLAIPFVDESVRDGMALGVADREAGVPFSERYRLQGSSGIFSFSSLGYRIGFDGDESMKYRVGKAQGEVDRKNGRRSVLKGSLTMSSTDYVVGYFDGFNGGYAAGMMKGEHDREEADAARRRLYDYGGKSSDYESGVSKCYYEPPKEDVVFVSCFAIGYRTGYRSKDYEYLRRKSMPEGRRPPMRDVSYGEYQEGSLKGADDRDSGKLYDPSVGNEDVGKLWTEGYHDGYYGGYAAGMLEGKSDRDNGKPYRPPSGRFALSDFAIGYRTAYRPILALDIAERDEVDPLVDYKFAEYQDGKTMGTEDCKKGVLAKDQTDARMSFIAGYHRNHYSPFAAGYREGYGPKDSGLEFFYGLSEGIDDSDAGAPAKGYRSDSPRDAGYRAGYYERMTENKGKPALK